MRGWLRVGEKGRVIGRKIGGGLRVGNDGGLRVGEKGEG